MENKIPSIFDCMLLFTLLDTSNYHLVGGLEHVLFSISYMGCHPSHWRTPSFFKMVKAPPTSHYFRKISRNCETMDPWQLAPDMLSSCWVFGTNCCMNKWRLEPAALDSCWRTMNLSDSWNTHTRLFSAPKTHLETVRKLRPSLRQFKLGLVSNSSRHIWLTMVLFLAIWQKPRTWSEPTRAMSHFALWVVSFEPIDDASENSLVAHPS